MENSRIGLTSTANPSDAAQSQTRVDFCGPSPAPALARAATAKARKHPSAVHSAVPLRPALASRTMATPAPHTSTPATVDQTPVAGPGASHHGKGRCSRGPTAGTPGPSGPPTPMPEAQEGTKSAACSVDGDRGRQEASGHDRDRDPYTAGSAPVRRRMRRTINSPATQATRHQHTGRHSRCTRPNSQVPRGLADRPVLRHPYVPAAPPASAVPEHHQSQLPEPHHIDGAVALARSAVGHRTWSGNGLGNRQAPSMLVGGPLRLSKTTRSRRDRGGSVPVQTTSAA